MSITFYTQVETSLNESFDLWSVVRGSTILQDIPETIHLVFKTNKQKHLLYTGYPLFVGKDCWPSISTEGIGIIMHHACVIVRCTK